MAEKKTKTASPQKRIIPLRNAGEKITNDDERPSKSLFDEVKRQIDNEAPVPIPIIPEQSEAATLTRQSSQSSQSSQAPLSIEDFPVSPIKNFQKVPNSITSQAIPQGLFRAGKSKHLYDVLYSLTRGAIIPSRKVRMSKSELMKKSGIGSRITFDTCISHLQQVGLLKVNVFSGQHFGNEFEVFLPDEIDTQPSQARLTRLTTQPSQPSSTQNLDRVVSLENSQTRQALINENKDTSANAKTLIKTKEEKRIDDEPAAAFRPIFEKLNEVFKDVTGREATGSDEQKLSQLGELIAAEFVEAASRTKIVSDPAAFLLTHMRRRLGVRSIKVETPTEKETGKGTASTKPTKREIQLTDDEIQECPDCQGRLLIYPGGPGKGAVMCRHQPLIKAKKAEAQKTEE